MNVEMSLNQWKRVAEVFAEVVQQPTSGRAEYQESVCREDTAVRREVEKVIQAHEGAGDFLEHPALHAATASTAAQFHDASHRRDLPNFGDYHIVGVLGEAGMGIVYLAEQRRPIWRRVALNL